MIEGGRLDPRFEPVAVCSRKIETGSAFAEKHSIPMVFTSVEEMAGSDGVDAVYIVSPNSCHARQAIACMERGKHVICEKPLASNAAEVSMMIEAARRNGVVLMEAMLTTLSPAFKAIAGNLPRVGTVRRFFASYCQYSSRYDRLKRGDIANAFRPELSNGGVMDIGVYCLYPMVALFGRPRSVLASVMKLETGVDGQGSVICSYDGFDAVVIYSKIADSFLPSEIQGEEGTLTVDRINQPGKVVFTPHDKSLSPEILVDSDADNPYYHEIKEFIDIIESGAIESRINTLDNSLATAEVIDEIRRQGNVVFPADAVSVH